MLGVIVKKELKRVFSDRRLVFSAFILPAISIFILYSLMGSMLGRMSDDINKHNSLITVVNAPESFINYMENKKEDFVINFQENSLDRAKDQLKNGDIDLIIEFQTGFDEAILMYETAAFPNINTFYNPAEEYSQTAMNKIEYATLSSYKSYLLGERFGGIDKLTAFTLNAGNENNKIAKEGREAGLGFSFIFPMLLNVMLFAGAMGIGIDVIAGEKERGTMATMLLTPVNRNIIAMGKVLSLGIVASISAMATFGAVIASLPSAAGILSGGAEMSISSIAFKPTDFIMLLIILIMQVGIFVGIICLVSIIARSVKEAGTYVSPVYMLVMVSSFATVFSSGNVELYKFTIPILGNVFAIKELFTFDLSLTEFAVTSVISLVVIGVLLKVITTIFNNEKIMFNA